MAELLPREVLAIEMDVNDARAATIHDYLRKLLAKLWAEGERFSGKRPFGKSGWKYDLYKAMIKSGAVEGKLDQDGFVQELSENAKRSADTYIFAAIESM